MTAGSNSQRGSCSPDKADGGGDPQGAELESSAPATEAQLPENGRQDCDDDGQRACYICLGPHTQEAPLCRPCACPRDVHLRCLSTWQLHSAGKREERTCRFCGTYLPDWRNGLSPGLDVANSAIMGVYLDDKYFQVRVSKGPNGVAQFKAAVKEAFELNEEDELDLSFLFAVPHTEDYIQLEGDACFDAALHCATVSATERERGDSQEQLERGDSQEQLERGDSQEQ